MENTLSSSENVNQEDALGRGSIIAKIQGLLKNFISRKGIFVSWLSDLHPTAHGAPRGSRRRSSPLSGFRRGGAIASRRELAGELQTHKSVHQKQNRKHQNVEGLHVNSPTGIAWTREG